MRVGDVGVKGKIIQKRRRVVVAVWWEVCDRVIYRKTLTEFFFARDVSRDGKLQCYTLNFILKIQTYPLSH